MHYTPAQTRWFVAAIERAEADEHRALVAATRVARNAGPRKLAEYLKAVAAAGEGTGHDAA